MLNESSEGFIEAIDPWLDDINICMLPFKESGTGGEVVVKIILHRHSYLLIIYRYVGLFDAGDGVLRVGHVARTDCVVDV